MNERLTSKSYWDKLHDSRSSRPHLSYSDHHPNVQALQPFFEKYLIPTSSFFEIGCGSSAWLDYLSARYNIVPYGIDYCPTGVSNIRQVLSRIPTFKNSQIICDDFLVYKPVSQYDVVFSYGVFEHFESTSTCYSIASQYLKPHSVLITLVPNLSGLSGLILKYIFPDIYSYHKVLSPSDLISASLPAGLLTASCSYIGVCNLSVTPWSSLATSWPSIHPVILKLILLLANYLNKFLNLLPLSFLSRMHPRFFCPYVLHVSFPKI